MYHLTNSTKRFDCGEKSHHPKSMDMNPRGRHRHRRLIDESQNLEDQYSSKFAYGVNSQPG